MFSYICCGLIRKFRNITNDSSSTREKRARLSRAVRRCELWQGTSDSQFSSWCGYCSALPGASSVGAVAQERSGSGFRGLLSQPASCSPASSIGSCRTWEFSILSSPWRCSLLYSISGIPDFAQLVVRTTRARWASVGRRSAGGAVSHSNKRCHIVKNKGDRPL